MPGNDFGVTKTKNAPQSGANIGANPCRRLIQVSPNQAPRTDLRCKYTTDAAVLPEWP